MELATIRTLETVERVQRHSVAESWLSALAFRPVASAFDWFFARSMRSNAEQLSQIVLLLRSLVQFDGDTPVDADLELRDVLNQVMARNDNLLRVTRKILARSEDAGMKRLATESRRNLAVAEELRAAALHLQWEMAEHDASLAVHHSGFAASDANSLNDMLDRITAA